MLLKHQINSSCMAVLPTVNGAYQIVRSVIGVVLVGLAKSVQKAGQDWQKKLVGGVG
jgi:hypothetical protein